MHKLIYPGLLLVLGLTSFTCNLPDPSEYDIAHPDKKFELHESLNEISGITDINNNRIACIHDEDGIIFILDLSSGEIVSQFRFAGEGDYEGITRVDQTFYVLQSTGVLFEVTGCYTGNIKTRTYETSVPAKNNEGLCYDAKSGQLLIGCKSKPGEGSEYKDIRSIYAFDLKHKTLIKDPVFEFSVPEITEYARSKDVELPVKVNKKSGVITEKISLAISGIAIHPETGDLYMLSALDNLFLIFDHSGEIKDIKNLPKDLYPQAEGITFLDNGNMVIASEGQDKKALLHVFER